MIRKKVHPDTEAKKDLRNNEGLSFIDRITPGDIAFVILAYLRMATTFGMKG